MAQHSRRYAARFVVVAAVWGGLAGCEDARRTMSVGSINPAANAPALAPAAPIAPPPTDDASFPPGPSVARGKYVVEIGGCNDCHTPEFPQTGGNVPEDRWLTGVPVGFKGPWGTTYPSNLRLFFRDMPEDLWVQVARSRTTRPPMVWPSLHAMSDDDLRSVYRYVKSLPVTGEQMPAFVPPGEEPTTAYFDMTPQAPKGSEKARADAR